jgi:hypothetical protein
MRGRDDERETARAVDDEAATVAPRSRALEVPVTPADNRRFHDRLPVQLNVHFARGDLRFVLQSENLSLGGILLKGAEDVCVVGDELHLDVIVPDARGEPEIHALRGTIVQVKPDFGVGVRFDWHQSMLPARAALVRFIERMGMDNSPLAHAESTGLSTTAATAR